MDKMRSKSVVVFVNAKDGSYEKSPEPVRKAIADPALGNYVPRLAVFDPAVKTKFGTMSYEQIKSGSKGFREINKAIKAGMDSAGAAGGAAAGAPGLAPRWDGKISDGEQEDWTSAAGTKIRAQAVRFDGGRLSLMKPDGKVIQVTLQQLDGASQARAQELIDAAKAAAR